MCLTICVTDEVIRVLSGMCGIMRNSEELHAGNDAAWHLGEERIVSGSLTEAWGVWCEGKAGSGPRRVQHGVKRAQRHSAQFLATDPGPARCPPRSEEQQGWNMRLLFNLTFQPFLENGEGLWLFLPVGREAVHHVWILDSRWWASSLI